MQFLKKQLNKTGFDLIKINKEKKWPTDFEDFHISSIKKVSPFTMTSPERIFGLIESVKYLVVNNIEGDIVECGVWKGGSMLAIANTLLQMNITDRQLYLYDTFEGMSEPTQNDISFDNQDAQQLLKSNKDKEQNLIWAYSTLETVKETMSLCTYPTSNMHFIKGKVENTIPGIVPEKIALLRLDTDWYESTKHELNHLFPKLVKGGVLIIDDYGFWKGARKAVDEFIAENNIQILLNRLDDTGRIAIKF
jgi:hypothetical protein